MKNIAMKVAALAIAALILAGCGEKKQPGAIPTDREVEAKVESVLKGMTLKEKAGQMVQINISALEDDTHEAIDPAKLDKVIGEYKVGSILNV
ncbi:MAG: beta-glucosidase, partial [Bacteroidales bacterium]|nr:beta-glucosidase [Bacteroidales bacterium]